jgi:hypothetical protein
MKNKRIAWIATPYTESEYDLARCQVIDTVFYAHCPPSGPLFTVGCEENTVGYLELLRKLALLDVDLFVFRHPYWLASNPVVCESFQKLFDGRPVIAWCSEMGVSRKDAITAAKPFQCVASSSRYEMPIYREQLNAKILFLPFGCSPHMAGIRANMECHDVVADGVPHYDCSEHTECYDGDWKRQSVDVMVKPLLDLDIQLWGASLNGHGIFHEYVAEPTEGPCGWSRVPGAAPHYRGVYPSWDYRHIYDNCRIYTGITWNWKLGGYGAKLVRAMSTGIPVLWHYTVGMEADGLAHGVNLYAPVTADDTRNIVDLLLKDPEARWRVGHAGREFAFDQWDWGKNLLRIIEEL